MPLRAQINGEEKTSINYTDEQWDALKTGIKDNTIDIVLPCCKQRGTLRKSSKGLKHFLHVKDQMACDWKPESAEHLKAKVEIIKACMENGWLATPEYAEEDWRADVLATKDGKRIAFEIQWSAQTNDDTALRQDKYKASNVRGCWFFRTIPKQLRYYGDEYLALKEMPFFKIVRSEPTTLVEFNKRTWNLENFVSNLLNGKLKFCEEYSMKEEQELEIMFFDTSCWKCHRPQYSYLVKTSIISRCGNEMSNPWHGADVDLFPEIVDVMREIVASEKEYDFKVGEIKERYSNTRDESYVSHGCYYCDALFGDWFVHDEKRDALEVDINPTFKRKVSLHKFSLPHKHWCYSDDKKFCE